jgi:hypothetical protein
MEYDPYSPEELIPAALRERALVCQKVSKKLWEKVLRVEGAGMYRTVECGTRGHVHVNLVYFGPKPDAVRLREVAQAIDCRMGRIDIQEVRDSPGHVGERVRSDDSRGSAEGLKRVAQYVSKGIAHSKSAYSESWLSGERVGTSVDPALAARWEVATYRMHLVQRFGALRGLKFDEHGEDSKPEPDAHVMCTCCGTVGEFRSVPRNTERWLWTCHSLGLPGLERSDWKPPPSDDYD